MAKNSIDIPVLAEPDSLWAEQIYLLRAEVVRQMRSGRRIFLFTSSWEGEGKSSILVSLAASLAVVGKSVLLVDCDLRRPTLSAFFDLRERPGLSMLGAGEVPVHPSAVRGLDVLPAGPMEGKAAADVLSDATLGPLLERLALSHDCLLLDTPPLSACKDALLVGKWCHGAYLVVREAKFTGPAEGHFCEDLHDYGVPVLGAVLNHSHEIKIRRRGWWSRLRSHLRRS